MILDDFFGSVINEQQEDQNLDMTDEDPSLTDQLAGPTNGDPPEFEPIKKYYILEKLQQLQSRLSARSITSSELDTILKFGNDLSYSTLVRLADNISDILALQLKRLEDKSKNKDTKLYS